MAKKMKKCSLCGADPMQAAFHDIRGNQIFNLIACSNEQCPAQSALMTSEAAASNHWNSLKKPPATKKKATAKK